MKTDIVDFRFKIFIQNPIRCLPQISLISKICRSEFMLCWGYEKTDSLSFNWHNIDIIKNILSATGLKIIKNQLSCLGQSPLNPHFHQGHGSNNVYKQARKLVKHHIICIHRNDSPHRFTLISMRFLYDIWHDNNNFLRLLPVNSFDVIVTQSCSEIRQGGPKRFLL